MERYHVLLDDRRTTVSLTSLLSHLLAIRLDEEPGSEEAHTVIREWLQDKLDDYHEPERIRVSQWLQGEVILELVDKELSARYLEWLFDRWKS